MSGKKIITRVKQRENTNKYITKYLACLALSCSNLISYGDCPISQSQGEILPIISPCTAVDAARTLCYIKLFRVQMVVINNGKIFVLDKNRRKKRDCGCYA